MLFPTDTYAARWYQVEADEAWWQSLFPFTGQNPVVVLPTGSGKSVSIGMHAKRVIGSGARLVIIQHRQELIRQNAEKVAAFCGEQNVGVYSAGLKSRDIDQPIICAGIQSVYEKAALFGRRHAVVVDEAHLVPRSSVGMYRTFFDGLSQYNPKLRISGLTATPFRTDSGPLCSPDGIFQRIVYSAPVARLIAEGFLCPITNQPTETTYDTSHLHVRGGEFASHEVESLFGGDDAKIHAACREISRRCVGRHSVLVFCAGVAHAEAVARHLGEIAGEEVGIVVGSTDPLSRGTTLHRFKRGQLRWLVGVDVLTTGFDAPCVDAISILRATESPGLFAQICGRGFRVDPTKTDCLLLDFGGNLERHGPLDDPNYGRRRGGHGETTGEAPVKACPNCEINCHAAATECRACGFIFPARELKHGTEADTSSAVLAEAPKPERWLVKEWTLSRHKKKWTRCDDGCEFLAVGETCDACGAKRPHDTLRVDYKVEPIDREGNLTGKRVSEWVCLEHPGRIRDKAFAWWGEHTIAPVPSGIDESIDLFKQGALGMPSEITTIQDGQWERITARVVPSKPASWAGDSYVNEWGEVADPAPPMLAGGDEADIPF